MANASSPYLQEHADNPVDWYEWGDEAITIAKKKTGHYSSASAMQRVIGAMKWKKNHSWIPG